LLALHVVARVVHAMNPYPERISELHDHLHAVWSQRDTQATEILLAALLPASLTRMRRPWLILETDHLSRDTSGAWFSLGMPELVQARSLAVPRSVRARDCRRWCDNVLAEDPFDQPGVFVDAEWRTLPNRSRSATVIASYYALLARCVHVRVSQPKSDIGVRTMNARESDRLELARLTRRVLDNAHRSIAHGTPQGVPLAAASTGAATPQALYYWSELVQKLAPAQHDWECLTGSVAAVAHGIATLYNDGRAPAYDAAERVLRDTVPYATARLILDASHGPVAARMAHIQSGGVIGSGERVTVELKRLEREGVLTKRRGHHKVLAGAVAERYKVAHQDWATLLDRDERILV
jgi:hypothetical protein